MVGECGVLGRGHFGWVGGMERMVVRGACDFRDG